MLCILLLLLAVVVAVALLVVVVLVVASNGPLPLPISRKLVSGSHRNGSIREVVLNTSLLDLPKTQSPTWKRPQHIHSPKWLGRE